MLKNLCEIDYVNTMAYVATVQENDAEKEIGVCRYAEGEDATEREIAITVADDYPYIEVATVLMKALVKHAKANNVKRLFSIELSTNHRMRKLADSLGMQAKIDPSNANQIIYSMQL
jgi:acetyltransferase